MHLLKRGTCAFFLCAYLCVYFCEASDWSENDAVMFSNIDDSESPAIAVIIDDRSRGSVTFPPGSNLGAEVLPVGRASREDEAILAVLGQIKVAMDAGNSTLLERHWNYKFHFLDYKVDQNIMTINDQFESLRASTQQKVDLMLENLAVLRLLLTEQGDELKIFNDRFLEVVEATKVVKEQQEKDRQTIFSDFPGKLGLKTYSDSKPINSYLISDVLSVSSDSPQSVGLPANKNSGKDDILRDKIDSLFSDVERLRLDATSHALQIEEIKKTTDSIMTRNMSLTEGSCKHPCVNENITDVLLKMSAQLAQTDYDSASEKAYKKCHSDINMIRRKLDAVSSGHDVVQSAVDLLKQDLLHEKELRQEGAQTLDSTVSSLRKQINLIDQKVNAIVKKMDNEVVRPVLSETSSELCVYPYEKKASGCYYVHTKETRSWSDSRKYCSEIQGDLAVPFAFAEFRNFLLEKRISRSYTFWVGATDQDKEGQWWWVDGHEVAMTEEIWQSGHPSQDKGKNCMELNPLHRFVAVDQRCSSRRYFICQQQ